MGKQVLQEYKKCGEAARKNKAALKDVVEGKIDLIIKHQDITDEKNNKIKGKGGIWNCFGGRRRDPWQAELRTSWEFTDQTRFVPLV